MEREQEGNVPVRPPHQLTDMSVADATAGLAEGCNGGDMQQHISAENS